MATQFATIEDIFDWLLGLLRQSFVHDEAELPLEDGKPVWPLVGADSVVWYNGDPEDAIDRSITNFRSGRYKTTLLLGFSTQQKGQESAAGWEFNSVIPLSVLCVVSKQGRSARREDEDPATSEAVGRKIARIHDAVYLRLKQYAAQPFLDGVENFTYVNSFALIGGATWDGVRLGYAVERIADDPARLGVVQIP